MKNNALLRRITVLMLLVSLIFVSAITFTSCKDKDNDVPDINIDTDGDGNPDINIDSDGDGNADTNIDTDGDQQPDVNIDTDGDGTPDNNVDFEQFPDGIELPIIPLD